MSSLSLYNYLKRESFCEPVNLFENAHAIRSSRESSRRKETKDGTSGDDANHAKDQEQSDCLSVIIDSESCLDRLYGGYYSDWASGGQWNRMLSYIANLSKACRVNNLHITVSMRGGVEKEHAESHFSKSRDFKDRLNRMMIHLQNRGTPPPKVWWLPPTCLRETIALAMQFYGVPVLYTSGDYYTEVMEYLYSHNINGILTDDPAFALLNPPRMFTAHDFKLTYKGSLETKEYFLHKMSKASNLKPDRYPLLASLLGNHIVTTECLKEFHLEISGEDDPSKTVEETEVDTIAKVIEFVATFADPKNIEAIGNIVFRSSCISIESGISKLEESVSYYESFATKRTAVMPEVVKSTLDIQPVKCDAKHKHRKKNAVVGDEDETDDSLNTSDSPQKKSKGKAEKKSTPVENAQSSDATMDEMVSKLSTHVEDAQSSDATMEDMVSKLSINGDIHENGAQKIHLKIQPSDAILKLALDRHSKGFMSSFIVQSLVQREVRLPSYLENISQVDDDKPSIIEIYRPIRRSIYAILHNLNKHLYDSRKDTERDGFTAHPGIIDGITVTVVEHYLGPLGSEMKHEVKVKPVLWPVPSIESLWLGVKPENKVRRMKAFLSAMQTGSNPFIANPAAIPEHYLLICCTVRYLLKCSPMAVTVSEVDAILAMATCNLIFDVQTMQDMQLPLITPRGAHVASLLMAGIQHAMLVNDACGAPIRRQSTYPWLFFDGKLLQYKLLKAASTPQLRRIDLCDGLMHQVVIMERLRQAVWYGMDHKLGEKVTPLHFSLTPTASALPGGRMFATTTAYLRPNFSAGRGKGSLMGDFMPVNARLDGRGGKLQVAGQVVATWGPRPSTGKEQRQGSGEHHAKGGDQSGTTHPEKKKKKQGYLHNRKNKLENKNQNSNQSSAEAKLGKMCSKCKDGKAVTIATKDEKERSEVEAGVSEVKVDISEVKVDVSEVKTDVSEVNTDISEVNTDISEVKADVSEKKSDAATTAEPCTNGEATSDDSELHADTSATQETTEGVE